MNAGRGFADQDPTWAESPARASDEAWQRMESRHLSWRIAWCVVAATAVIVSVLLVLSGGELV